MIPTDRPVLGRDLDAVRQQFGLLVADACWLFGLSITKWMHIVRQAPDEPVRDPTLALLVRFLDAHPELVVLPRAPAVEDMYAKLAELEPMDQKRFSILFGSEASASYRWLKLGTRCSPAVLRLMHYLDQSLESQPSKAAREMLLIEWAEAVREEGQARGVADVFRSGKWRPSGKSSTAAEDGGEGQLQTAGPEGKKLRRTRRR